jgi:hypothetical protein
MAIYASLSKKHGLVESADKKRSESQKPSEKDKQSGRVSPEVTHVRKPTLTEALTNQLGTTGKNVHERIRQAAEVAEASGVQITTSKTPEALSAETLARDRRQGSSGNFTRRRLSEL